MRILFEKNLAAGPIERCEGDASQDYGLSSQRYMEVNLQDFACQPEESHCLHGGSKNREIAINSHQKQDQ
jgi:hypothetical protein